MNHEHLFQLLKSLHIRGNGKTTALLKGLDDNCVVVVKNYNTIKSYKQLNPLPTYISDFDKLHGLEKPILIDHEVIKTIICDYLELSDKYNTLVENLSNIIKENKLHD